MFNNRLINIIVILVFIYLFLHTFNTKRIFNTDLASNRRYDPRSAVFKLEFDPKKEYKDYNPVEKFVYKKYQTEIDQAIANKKGQSQ